MLFDNMFWMVATRALLCIC